jgi:hypothetical protein
MMSIPSTGRSRDEVPTSGRSRPAFPDFPIQYAPLTDWLVISGLRRTRTYELLGRGLLRAVKLGNRTLIDVPHGLAYLAQLPEAKITTGTGARKPRGQP